MTGLFIIAHAPLASALRAAALHTFPEAAQALAVYDVPPAATAEDALAEATQRLAAMGAAETLILTDVFGATPCNIARQLAEQPGVRVVAGVNVPMLWRALNYRQKPLDDMVALALAGATQGVMPVAVTRPQNQAQKPASHDPNDRHHQQ
ncbi:PTS sugar transporter subunit IIA [Pseudaquabacterium pictum]|uniref:PTS fructose transporter subunit IIA n=1 Tax=Pseudaquabacterium pictum TaxID=2315236 RepID=A0A480AXN4_9BURK|nr:PTS fructose transporter subunit IIA [Rubrivivax pictus]GCL65710.1 PTS fructose transporter subunit IIA [Rubrivivax pictus]